MSEAAASFQIDQQGSLSGLLGFNWIDARRGFVQGQFEVEKHHLVPITRYLHAASVVALADSACGFGCTISLPEGASSFTIAELKANFIGTAREGGVRCDARLVHAGRTTQVWDAMVSSENYRQDDSAIPMHSNNSLSLALTGTWLN
jgi:uncharacterized protein (TIGR00369 family)